MAARLQRGKAVEISRVHVIESVFAAANVQSVAVSKKWLSALFAHVICHDSRVLRTEMSKISQLSEVNLDCDVTVAEIDRLKAGALHKAMQFFGQSLIARDMKIREKHLRLIHFYPSS